MKLRSFSGGRAKFALLAPTLLGKLPGFWAYDLRFPELLDAARNRQPFFEPYQKLSAVYHDYSSRKLADYSAFLAQLARRHHIELRSVLDLACGSGTTTERLATRFDEIVGLDGSEAMLAEAGKRCARFPSVRFVHTDWRAFDLPQQFDAAVSATNSLNYVRDLSELGDIFQQVAKHLRPGGLFVFDTVTANGMRLMSGMFLHLEVNGVRLAYNFNYDRQQRREETVVIFRDGVELHRRIPLDPRDVEAAGANAGLRLCDYFSSLVWPGRWSHGAICYFVLRKESAVRVDGFS